MSRNGQSDGSEAGAAKLNSPSAEEQASLTRSTVKGVVWITTGRLVRAPLNLFAVAVLARLLTPTDFGVVALAFIVVTFTNVIVDGSFGMVLVQKRSIDPRLIGASLAVCIALASSFGAAIIVGAPFLQREFNIPQLGDVLTVLGAVVPVIGVTTVTGALLQRKSKFDVLIVNGLITQAIYVPLAIGLAFAGFGLWSLIWAQSVQYVLDALLGYLVVRKHYRFGFSTSALWEVLTSGGMFTIARLLSWAANSVDRIVIGRYVGAAQLGLYSRAVTLMTTVMQVSGAGPIKVLFASLSKIQHDRPRMARAYFRALSVASIAATLVSALVIVNAEAIVRILLGPRWLAAVPLMQILFSAFVARSGYAIAEAVPLALGLSGQSAVRQGAQLGLVLAGAAAGARFGVVGAAIGISIAYWLFYFICLMLAQRLLQASWGEIFRLHFNGIVIAAPPTLLALAARWLIGGESLLAMCVPIVVFAATALAVLAFAPARLVSDDAAGARAHLWEKLSPHLPGLVRPR